MARLIWLLNKIEYHNLKQSDIDWMYVYNKSL